MSGNKNKLIAFNYFGGKFTCLEHLYANFPTGFTHLVDLFAGFMCVVQLRAVDGATTEIILNSLAMEEIFGNITLYNADCMDIMRGMPDKAFDLAIVDPPYGIGEKRLTQGGTWAEKYKKGDWAWDKVPTREYFEELFRVSRNQIIWGGNYFELPPTRGFIVWDKIAHMPTMAHCEYAWTSFDVNARIIHVHRTSNYHEERIHPTQKPLRLYESVLKCYAQRGDGVQTINPILTMTRHIESHLQRTCVGWFRLQYPAIGKLLFAVPNGGARSRTEAAIMKAEGVTAGVTDLILLVGRGGFNALCIEMKTTDKRSRLTLTQAEWQALAVNQGSCCVTCRTFDEFVDEVRRYMALPENTPDVIAVCDIMSGKPVAPLSVEEMERAFEKIREAYTNEN